MSHSNSSLNCFANCMAKYELNYILHEEPDGPISPHLTFGTMAHEVLYKAGKLRDDSADGVVTKDDYYNVIPSEVLYPELKEHFGIKNWTSYFRDVIKCTADYEKELVDNMLNEFHEPITIERELKLQLTVEQLKSLGIYKIDQPLVGIIDCLIITKNHAIILDYKFSSSRKSQDDFDMNSQLQLYAFFVHTLYKIPVRNIQIGYIDIPKKSLDSPTVLSSGLLSRAKSQNVSQELYARAVLAVHGDDAYYNCEPGGFYYDAWCNMALNKAAYLSIQYVDEETYECINSDLIKAAQIIDLFVREGIPFLRKYDSYTCKGCEYLSKCKKWLTMED